MTDDEELQVDQTDQAIRARDHTRARLEGGDASSGPSERNRAMLTAIEQINGRLDRIEAMLVLQLKGHLRHLRADDPLREEIVGSLAAHQDYQEMRHGG